MSLIDDHRAAMAAAQFSAAPPPPTPPCRSCGSVPAADVTFRRNEGYILMRRTYVYRGPFCRDCGIAMFRKATAKALLTGWWGYISVVMTPVYLITNIKPRLAVGRLSAPQSPAPGRQPLPVGRPVYLRWQFAGVLLPIAVVALIIGLVQSGSSSGSGTGDDGYSSPATVGSCVRNVGDTESDIVSCSSQHDGRVTQFATDASLCPAGTAWDVLTLDESDGSVMCVEANTN
jgi:hypothetical protein